MSNQQPVEALEPCWCRKETRWLRVEPRLDHGQFGCLTRGFYVYCGNCGIQGPIGSTERGAIEYWNKSRSSSLSAATGDEWLPIESAPRDSSWILGLTQSRRQVVVRWGGGTWEDDNRLCRDPLMWRPLPALPGDPTSASSPAAQPEPDDRAAAIDHWFTMYSKVSADNTELADKLAARDGNDLISRQDAIDIARSHDYTHSSGYRCNEGNVIAKKIAALPVREPDIRTAVARVSRAIAEGGLVERQPAAARSWVEGKDDIPTTATPETLYETPDIYEATKEFWGGPEGEQE